MQLHEAFVKHLTEHPLVSGLIGSRLYPQLIPENAVMPAMAYQVVSLTDDPLAHDGAIGIVTRTYQFTCQADRYNETQAMTAALRNALHGFSGQMGGDGGVEISVCQFVSMDDGEAIEGVSITRCDYKFIYMEE